MVKNQQVTGIYGIIAVSQREESPARHLTNRTEWGFKMADRVITDAVTKTKRKHKQRWGGGAPTIDKTGMRFQHLLVVKLAPKQRDASGKSLVAWECLCDCGTTIVVQAQRLKLAGRGRRQSCGCANRLIHGAEHPDFVHGLSSTPEYRIWYAAKCRVFNENNKQYKDYGGRGISMSTEWASDFRNFYRDMAPRPKGMTLGRIDNNGPYSKENCRWETMKEQQQNRRSSRFITYNGESKTASQWSEISGVPGDLIRSRSVKPNWSAERAIWEPAWANGEHQRIKRK